MAKAKASPGLPASSGVGTGVLRRILTASNPIHYSRVCRDESRNLWFLIRLHVKLEVLAATALYRRCFARVALESEPCSFMYWSQRIEEMVLASRIVP